MVNMYGQNKKKMEIKVNSFVIHEIYYVVVNGVKQQALVVVGQLINELEVFFPSQELMDELGMVYP
jgi:hypothetical protein